MDDKQLMKIFDLNKQYKHLKDTRTVEVNNQNTQLLKRIRKINNVEFLFLLHDTRIFVFERNAEATGAEAVGLGHESKRKNKSSVSCKEQDLVMNILTTRGFRSLNFMYLIFRLLDNIGFVAIIVLSIYYGDFKVPDGAQLALYGTIGLEAFYNLMITINKYWNLQRLSLYIGFLLFSIYFGIVDWMYQNDDSFTYDNYVVTMWIVCIRLLSFLAEEMVDIGIDRCLHNMLVLIQRVERTNGLMHATVDRGCCLDAYSRMSQWCKGNEAGELLLEENTSNCCCTCRCICCCCPKLCEDIFGLSDLAANPLEELNTLHEKNCGMPKGVSYRGSFNSWGLQSIFTWAPDNNVDPQYFDNGWTCWLCFAPAILPTIAICFVIAASLSVSALVMAGLVLLWWIILKTFDLMTCCCPSIDSSSIQATHLSCYDYLTEMAQF